MNVVLVNDHLSLTGGVARVAISEAAGLKAAGFNVIYFGAAGLPADELLESGVRIVNLDQPEILADDHRLRAAWRGIRNRAACDALAELLATLDPRDTIVHFHSWMKALSPAILAVPRQCGFKCVLTLHDFFLRCPNGGFIEHPRTRICHRVPLSRDCITCNCDSRSYAHKGWRVARQLFQDKLWKTPDSIDAFISVSAFCRDILRPYLPEGIPVTVVNNPVSVEERPRATERGEHFLFVGRLSREKGAHVFAEAAHKAGVSCRFVGEGEEADNVRKACPSAEILGWLPHRQVIEEVRKARALVFPSIWYETQGLTVLEAMGNGVPVIVSDCTAATEYTRDGVTGLHFKAGDTADLAAKIGRLNDTTEAERLGDNAYNWFWENPWSLKKHTQEVETVYAQVLNACAV